MELASSHEHTAAPPPPPPPSSSFPTRSTSNMQQEANDEENHHHHVINVEISAAAHDHLIPPQSPLAHRGIARGSTVIMKYLVLALLGLVSITYEGSAEDLLSKYPVQFWCLAGALCIYWTTMKILVSIGHLNTSKFNLNTLNCIALACEVLAVISLVSVLLPHDLSLLVFCATVYSTTVSAVVMLTYIYWFGKQECLSAPLQTIVQVHDDV